MVKKRRAVFLQEEAQTELQNSVNFYREQGGDALANRFKKHITDGLKTITENPELYPHTSEIAGVQKCQLRHFPFSILYVNLKTEIWVVAIAHGSRRPGFWTDRLHL